MGWWDSVIFDSNNLRMKYNWIIMLLVVSFAGCNGVEESLGDEPHDTELSDVESLIYGKWYPKVDVGEKIDVNFYPYFYQIDAFLAKADNFLSESDKKIRTNEYQKEA